MKGRPDLLSRTMRKESPASVVSDEKGETRQNCMPIFAVNERSS